MKFGSFPSAIVLGLLILSASLGAAQTVPPSVPNPVLYFIGQESVSSGRTSLIRYRYGVLNSSAYPDAMFASAPTLPPCGANTRSSRSWVDVLDSRGKRLYGFCAFGKSDNLNMIWFTTPEGEVPPSWIYIEISDRQTGAKYKSNLAETTN